MKLYCSHFFENVMSPLRFAMVRLCRVSFLLASSKLDAPSGAQCTLEQKTDDEKSFVKYTLAEFSILFWALIYFYFVVLPVNTCYG